MIGTIAAWDAGGHEAGVLEEIKVLPPRLFPVVRFAKPPARWTREPGARLGGDGEVQFVGLLTGVQPLIDNAPGRGQSEAEGEDAAAFHFGLRAKRMARIADAGPPVDRTVAARLIQSVRFDVGAVLATVKDASRRCAVAFGHP